MIYRSYNKETSLAIATMLSLFNNIVISRYDKNGKEAKQIKVPVKYAHTSTIVKSLMSKDKKQPLPVISVSRPTMERDTERLFDLHQSILNQGRLYTDQEINDPSLSSAEREKRKYSYDFRRDMPQPMNLGFQIKIWCEYEEDLNQILGNFLPWFSPCVYMSTKHPYDPKQLIRSRITWDGNVDQELPEELDTNTAEAYKATINFTYAGWYWYGNEKEKYSRIGSVIENVILDKGNSNGNINAGDEPNGNQYVDSETGNIYDGIDTGKNINDGDTPGENEFVDPETGKIYAKQDNNTLGVNGNFKDGFYITAPQQTIDRLEQLVRSAKTVSELPYRENAIYSVAIEETGKTVKKESIEEGATFGDDDPDMKKYKWNLI